MKYTMQRDDFQYTWDNKYQIEVVQLSVGFVKSLLEPKIKKSDLCQHRRVFLGFVHEMCIWTTRTINFTPVIGHNIANYDVHHVCLALREIVPSTKSVLPSTDEKFISITFGVLIKTVTGRFGKVKRITIIYASSILSSF